MRTRIIVLLVVGVTLAVPAGASAHARSTTVALDYGLQLDPTTRSIHSVSVAILDGDRALRASAKGVTVVVRGNLGEPMLRIGPRGAWVNRASITAVTEGLTLSLLSGTGSRTLLAIALVAGTGAAVTSFVGRENT